MRLDSKVLPAFFSVLFATCAFGATSYDGEWNGSLRCGASLSNPAKSAAFSHQITMVVAGKNAKITRNTNEVTESLTGEVTGSGHSYFSGSGQSKANDRAWSIKIDGQFSGAGLFSGSGEIYSAKGIKGRECSVELAKVVAQIPKTSQKSEAMPVVSVAKVTVAVETPTVAPAIPHVLIPVVLGASAANSQLQLECPQNWSALSDIDGPNPDKVIFGVMARDWKKEYLDQMLSKEEECLRSSSGPDSVKKATLVDVRTRAYPNGIKSIEARDQRQQQKIARAQQAVEEDQRRIEAQQQEQQQASTRAANSERDRINNSEEIAKRNLGNGQISAERDADGKRTGNFLIVLVTIVAAVGGLLWNKFKRNRCPKCKSTSYDTVNETETDRWSGNKTVTEKHSRGTNTRNVRTTYVKKLYEYRCKSCQNTWEKERKEEHGEGSALGRFLSGY